MSTPRTRILRVAFLAVALFASSAAGFAATAHATPTCWVGVCDNGVCVFKQVPCPTTDN